jgi:ABC-type uncharacterized transport system ATPase subunit
MCGNVSTLANEHKPITVMATTFLGSHDSHKIRSLCNEISVISSGRIVYTGATRDLGNDLDAFEEHLIHPLTNKSDG